MSSATKKAHSKRLSDLLKTPEESAFDFYRCSKCMRIITREQELDRIESNVGYICKCRSQKYYPSWPVGYEWLKPSVMRMTARLILARGVIRDGTGIMASVLSKLL